MNKFICFTIEHILEVLKTRLPLYNSIVLTFFFQGLTGLLQSPIKGAEKHGLPGVLSGN